MQTLAIKKREPGKLDALRASGSIPAVMYGRKEPSTPIAVDAKVFEKLFRQAGESTVITLEGVGEPKEALIHDVTVDPVTEALRHVDFYVIEKGKKLKLEVPLIFTGESPAVKNLGGTLLKVMHEVEVEAMPADLPRELTVDVSSLETFDGRISIKDIPVPAGVTILDDADETVVSVSQPKEEEEEVPAEAIDMDAIEVEKKGKKEEEEGEAAAESTDDASHEEK
jgi:large subunit ribosomal protein L25